MPSAPEESAVKEFNRRGFILGGAAAAAAGCTTVGGKAENAAAYTADADLTGKILYGCPLCPFRSHAK